MIAALTPAKPKAAQPSDSTLGADDRRSLGEFYDSFGAVAYSLAYSITADREQAERVVTRSFATAWNAQRPNTSAREFFAALMSAVRTNAVALRAIKRGEPLAHRFESSSAANGSLERAVSQALQELPDSQRNVLALAYFGGLAVGEIALELQAPMSYVKENLQAAMRHLRSVLKQRRTGTVSV